MKIGESARRSQVPPRPGRSGRWTSGHSSPVLTGGSKQHSRSSSSVSSTSSSADQRRHPFHHVHLDVAVDEEVALDPDALSLVLVLAGRMLRALVVLVRVARRGRGRPGPGCRGRGRPRRGHGAIVVVVVGLKVVVAVVAVAVVVVLAADRRQDHRRHDRLRDERLGRAEAPRVDDLVADAPALAVRVEVVPEVGRGRVEDVPADSLAGSPDDGRGVADEGAPVERVRLQVRPAGSVTCAAGRRRGPGHRPTGTDDHLVGAKRGSPGESRIVTASVVAPPAVTLTVPRIGCSSQKYSNVPRQESVTTKGGSPGR